MDSELAVLAASGATTLVSLMVTDSWAHARELVRHVLARTGSDTVALSDLDDTRSLLLTAPDGTAEEQAAAGARTQWQVLLQRLLEAGALTEGDLRVLLSSLQQLASASESVQGTVHNSINGGVHHGPVVQSGRITGLTFHIQGTPGDSPG